MYTYIVKFLNTTIPLLRITTPFSGPNDMFIAFLGSTNETTFTVVSIPKCIMYQMGFWLALFNNCSGKATGPDLTFTCRWESENR